MAEGMAWLGAFLLLTGVMGTAMEMALFVLLLPTRKSPDRPVYREGREYSVQALKLEAVMVCVGAVLLISGVVLLLASS